MTSKSPQNWDELLQDMRGCEQNQGQNVYQHGESVYRHLIELLDHMKGSDLKEWRLPKWIEEYKQKLLANIYSEDDVKQYTLYHDCGKPYCKVSEGGVNHFPNHAQISKETWLHLGGDPIVANLIGWDMVIHTATSIEIEEYLKLHWSCKDSITLLLVSLAEIHSNSKMFGGIDSISFKMKWKSVEKRGKQICKFWFN